MELNKKELIKLAEEEFPLDKYQSEEYNDHQILKQQGFITAYHRFMDYISIEDYAPEEGIALIVKNDTGEKYLAYYFEDKDREEFYNRPEPDIDFIIHDVIEWKYA